MERLHEQVNNFCVVCCVRVNAAHVKTTLVGCSLNIPICNGALALGTWQGVYLNEHRDVYSSSGSRRKLVVTVQGQRVAPAEVQSAGKKAKKK